MTALRIALLVEGDGEVQALPVLIRRIVQEINPATTAKVPPGFRHPSGSIRRAGGLERAISAVAQRYPDHAILVLIDSDDECPAKARPELAHRARLARPDLQIAVVLATLSTRLGSWPRQSRSRERAA